MVLSMYVLVLGVMFEISDQIFINSFLWKFFTGCLLIHLQEFYIKMSNEEKLLRRAEISYDFYSLTQLSFELVEEIPSFLYF